MMLEGLIDKLRAQMIVLSKEKLTRIHRNEKTKTRYQQTNLIIKMEEINKKYWQKKGYSKMTE